MYDKYGACTGVTEKRTYQRPKNLKWRIVCAGVQRLCEEKGLNEEDVALWVDLQSSTPHRSSNPPD